MSVDYIVSRLKISRADYYDYENSETEVPTDVLSRLAHVLNTSISYLRGETNDPTPGKILLDRPALRKLFDAAQTATTEQLEETTDFLNWLKHKEED